MDCKYVPSSEEYFELIGEYGGNEEELLQRWNADCVTRVNYRQAIVYLKRNSGEEFQMNQYPYAAVPRCFGLMDTAVLEDVGVSAVRRSELDLYGNGVLIALIDTGIDYRNPLFQFGNQTTKIEYLWDQTQENASPLQPYGFGVEYDKAQINQAIQSENPLEIVPQEDTSGHGTFLAGLMVGNEDATNQFSGVAPNAKLLVVKLRQAKKYLLEYYCMKPDVEAYAETDLMLAIRYVLEKAEILRLPLIINLGVGTNLSSHLGSGALSQYLSLIAPVLGIGVVVCGGNEGNTNHHYAGRIEEQQQEVEIKVGENEYGFTAELWGSPPNQFFVDIVSPTGQRTGKIAGGIRGQREVTFLIEGTRLVVNYFIVDSAVGAPVVSMRFLSPAAGVWRILVTEDGIGNSEFDVWLPIRNFISDETYFLEATPFNTLTTPSTTSAVMTVATYRQESNSIYVESGRGYPRNGMIKPDFAAPGVQVTGPLLRNRFGKKSGSSVAAAIVSGIAALMMEWGITKGNDPELNTIRMKDYLIRGAIRDVNREYPNREWGYGVVNLIETFLKIR